jgi:hypothetical protein
VDGNRIPVQAKTLNAIFPRYLSCIFSLVVLPAYFLGVAGVFAYILCDMDKHKKLAITFLAGKERSCKGKVRHVDEASAKEAAV